MLLYTIRQVNGVNRHVLLMWLAAGFLLHGQTGGRPGTTTSNAYVDAHQCAACHPKIAETYARTGMARSFYSPSPPTRIEDFDRGNPFHHERSGTWYAMLQRDGSLYQRRWRTDRQGREIHVQELRVDYVMGSGNHARTYLHRTPRGTLIRLPLGWYPENGGVWAMNPGYDHDYTLPPSNINYECMFCHNAYPAIPKGHDEPGSEPLFSDALPEGIDCQRCHGPGGNHVRAARSGANIAELRGSILNPARLSAERQMEVCLQCHLETTSLPLPHAIRKFDRGPFSYSPAEPLPSFQLFFDRASGGAHKDDFEIVHSAYRLRKSECFLKSSGRMTCTTCHNPHDIPRGGEATAHYNGVCRDCHAARIALDSASGKHPNGPDCVACHMPKRRTEDVVHAVMTDHWIQRRPPARDLLAPLAEREESGANLYRGEVVPYYPAVLPQTGESALYLALAQVTQRSNLAKGLPRLAAEILRQTPTRPEFYVELGQAWTSAGQLPNAIGAFEEAVRREPQSPVALLNLADACTRSRQFARAIAVLTRAVKTAPNEPLLWYQMGIAYSSLGQNRPAIAAFEKCLALDPDLAEAHNLLGAALAASGDLERADDQFLRALELHPDSSVALGNRGHLLAARGDLSNASFSLSRSVQLNANDAEVRMNYAVVLAAMGRFDEARKHSDAAVRLDPKSADARNFRGTLLEREGNSREALADYLAALRLRPDFGLAHLNAARLLAASDRAAAVEHLRAAAAGADPAIRAKAAAALTQMAPRK
jgi:predicted CXXCH cytochrome family protein